MKNCWNYFISIQDATDASPMASGGRAGGQVCGSGTGGASEPGLIVPVHRATRYMCARFLGCDDDDVATRAGRLHIDGNASAVKRVSNGARRKEGRKEGNDLRFRSPQITLWGWWMVVHRRRKKRIGDGDKFRHIMRWRSFDDEEFILFEYWFGIVCAIWVLRFESAPLINSRLDSALMLREVFFRKVLIPFWIFYIFDLNVAF